MKKQNKIDKRRRREGKTNYTKRLILLKGGLPRLVVRKSSRYVVLQIVESVHAQDKIVGMVSTKDLLKKGWPVEKAGSLKSLGAVYLAGLMLGKKYEGKKVILDSGLIPNTKGSRVYAAVKGVADAGVDIPYDEKVIPEKERIENFEFFNKVREGVE
ncbi:50S ribosomal protein L18 [Candidatus Pacearchaeota archaeon]|jgi:large subunit ribosomal protein L18|nr:50S ribosomal protein L18 [Candidatus Pacearchaeota archaeon]|tara:strand:+ start:2576 stop:3046 length:471 start_codon:yes stop_codon:yes gene_type:complete